MAAGRLSPPPPSPLAKCARMWTLRPWSLDCHDGWGGGGCSHSWPAPMACARNLCRSSRQTASDAMVITPLAPYTLPGLPVAPFTPACCSL